MFPLRYHLSDSLQHLLQLLHGTNDSAINEFEFGVYGCTKFIESGLVSVDVVESVRAIRVFGEDVIFRSDGLEDGGEMLSKVGTVREKCYTAGVKSKDPRLKEVI